MTNSPFRHFLVIHADGRLAGVFSDRDVLRALGRTPNWQAKNVNGVMTHKVFTVRETPLSVPWRPWQGRQGMRHYNFDRSIAKLPENSSLAGEFVQHGRSIYVIFMMGLVLLTDFA